MTAFNFPVVTVASMITLVFAASGQAASGEQVVDICSEDTKAISFVATDINGDGRDDLLFACGPAGQSNDDGHAEIRLGDSNGGFEAAETNRIVGDGVRFITAGHFNEDKRLDLALSGRSSDGHELSIVFADDDSAWRLGGQTIYPAGDGKARPIAAVDVDEDDHTDLLVPASNTYWEGGRRGLDALGDSRSLARGEPSANGVADVNGNGLPDAVLVSARSGKLYLYRGGSSGRTEVELGKSARRVTDFLTGGDFDGDGSVDLVVVAPNGGGSGVHILQGADSGSAQWSDAVHAGKPGDAVAVDLWDRGAVDLVLLESDGNEVSFLRGSGKGGFAAPQTLPVPGKARRLAAGDFDGDGDNAIALLAEDGSQVTLLPAAAFE